jgi:NAD+ kinase
MRNLGCDKAPFSVVVALHKSLSELLPKGNILIIAVFPNIKKKQSISLAIGIREFFILQGIKIVAPQEEASKIGAEPLESVDPKEIDFIISMGGDGTILRIIHSYSQIDAPILGINLGGLGFMADVPVSELYPSLQDLLNGAYRVEERIMIDGDTVKGEKCFAVNEMVVHRAHVPHLIELALHLDGVYLNTFFADGLIVATPSGSTAYSLAAGGPILTPELNAAVITPISPHTISNRPIVVSPDSEIQIQYLSELAPVEIIFDGISSYKMHTGEVFRIRKSKRTFKLISLLRNNYFATLRTKLGWTGKLKS